MGTKENRHKTADMTKTALCTAVLCASAYLVIPLPFTPVMLTMQTVVVNLTGLILKPRHAAYTIIIYLIMGLIGLPVFSAGTAGPGKLFGPTGGFYFGFLIAAIVISLLKGKNNAFSRYVLVTVAVGLPIQHLCAVLFMCFHNGFNLQAAFVSVSLPFIGGDIIKCILAAAIAVALNKVIKKE